MEEEKKQFWQDRVKQLTAIMASCYDAALLILQERGLGEYEDARTKIALELFDKICGMDAKFVQAVDKIISIYQGDDSSLPQMPDAIILPTLYNSQEPDE